MTPNFDAVIVGARCAGAATGMLLARAGARVLIVDRGQLGVDALSTHALMRGAVLQLQRWGVLAKVIAAGTPAVRSATFHYGRQAVTVPVKPYDGIDALYAPRRTVLDPMLVEAAASAGADVRHGVHLSGLVQDADGRVRGATLTGSAGGIETVHAGLVIGADGLRSTVARLVGARTYREGQHASGVIYGYWRGLAVDGYHWHQWPGFVSGAIPTNDDETLVFAGTGAPRFRDTFHGDVASGYRRVIATAAPEIASQFDRAVRRRALTGFPGVRGFFRQSWGAGWALVGDAGCFKDPITAHGITDALRDAELLSEAVLRGTEAALAEYQDQRDQMVSGLFDVSDALASFLWDLESVRPLHESLAREMSREVKAMGVRFRPADAAGQGFRQANTS